MQICDGNFSLFKYAGEMAMVGLMVRGNGEQERAYFEHIDHLSAWCEESALGAKGGHPSCQPVIIGGSRVEIVSSFKYLGTILDDNLSFNENTEFILKKATQRLFLIRKLQYV